MSGPAPEDAGPTPGPVDLPEAVRAQVLALAAAALSRLPEAELPTAVRAVRRFTPRKRVRLGAALLAATLESDPAFRQGVAAGVEPGLADAVRDGTTATAAPAARLEEVAAATYLLRPEGWVDLLRRAGEQLTARERARAAEAELDTVVRLTEQLATVRAEGRAQVAELTAALALVRTELETMTRRMRQAGARAAAAERTLAAAGGADVPADDASPDAPEGAGGADPAEVRRLRHRLQATEQQLAAARGATRELRHGDQVRLRVLLDAIVGASSGLRRELALAPQQDRPADLVAHPWTRPLEPPVVARQGRGDADPAWLDDLLAVPSVHLLVDGYNVTKTGYGEQVLEVQRHRLVTGLTALAARTGAEITVVFDGASVEGVRTGPTARGVRVLFSRAGETADDVLRALVDGEPVGRPLVVVTSDRAVVQDVRRAGATTTDSVALVGLLER